MPRCELCTSDVIDDLRFGKMITKEHYLSSNLTQHGDNKNGIYGFLIPDIVAEARRGMTLKCCYCGKRGASIGCCRRTCHKSFHLACGMANRAVNQFGGTYDSFCDRHVPPMAVEPADDELCVICLEELMTKSGFDRTEMIQSPCCNNGWYHKKCLQNYANTSGYFFKCPLCNSGSEFRDVVLWGIWVPNTDAEWEREPNAYVELMQRDTVCIAKKCRNRTGRNGEEDEFVYCTCCGSKPLHYECFMGAEYSDPNDYICDVCNSVFKDATTTSSESGRSEVSEDLQDYVDFNDDDTDDDDGGGDSHQSEVFKAQTTINASVQRPCEVVTIHDSDSDDPLENWDLFKENSRNVINVCSTEMVKPKEQAHIEKENHQTEASSNRQPLAMSTPNVRTTRNSTQRHVDHRSDFDENLAQEKKGDNENVLVDISCIGRRVLRPRNTINNNPQPRGGTIGIRTALRRTATVTNASSNTDEQSEVAPTEPKRRRATPNHNTNESCIANRVHQRHSLAIIAEENSNSALSSANSSASISTNGGLRRSSGRGNSTKSTEEEAVTTHSHQSNRLFSNFLHGLTEETTNINMDSTRHANDKDISSIGVRVHRRRIRSLQLDSEDSSSSSRGQLRRSRNN